MKIRHQRARRAPSLLLLMGVTLTLAGCQSPVVPDVEGSIEGSVTVGSGSPLGGVTATLDPGGQSVETNADGSFTFADLAPGSYTVTISGFPSGVTFPSPSRPVTVPPAGGAARVDFVGAWPPVAAQALDPPPGVVGEAYTVSLTATGGDGTYSWAISAGALPVGLALNATSGTISGTPTNAESVTTTATVSSGDGQSDDIDIDFSIYPVLEVTTETLPEAVVGTPYMATLAASGGDGSATWSLAAGALPSGVAMDSSSGALSGTVNAAGSATFTVRATSGDEQVAERELLISAWAPLEIDADPPVSGIVGVPYTHVWTAAGGTGPYTWTVSGGSLPDGLTLDPSTGELSGTPTSSGSFDFSVSVTSADGQAAEVSATLETFAVLVLSAPDLGSGVVGSAYTGSLSASGGDGSFSWSVTEGTLPQGLTLDMATGAITGTPTMVESRDFSIRVQSGDGQTADAEAMIVVWAELMIEVDTPPNGVVGVDYSHTWVASGGPGAHEWAITAGTPPEGLTLDPETGELSGTPTSAQLSEFTVSVTSTDGQSAEANVTVGTFDPLEFPAPDLPDGLVGAAYSGSLVASGGDGQLTWSLAEGTLPSGLLLSGSTGMISGTANAAGSPTATVRVESGDGQSVERMIQIDVWNVLTVTDSPVTDGQIEIDYQGGLEATGGDGQYSWTVTAGALPAGMALEPATGTLMGAPTTTGEFDFTAQVTSGDGQTAEGIFAFRVTLNPNSVCSSFPDSEVAAFADEVVAADVRTELGLDPADDITCGALTTITRLAVSDGGTDLAGLQNLTALDYLNIDSNGVTSLAPLSTLTALGDLRFSYNQITDISPLTGMTSIWRLRLEGNPIADFSVLSTLTGLTTVGLGETGITDLAPVVSLPVLTWLSVPMNGITDISMISTMTGLDFLNLRGNALTDISAVSALTSIRDLVLDQNPDLANVQPILDNPGITTGDRIFLRQTSVSCADVTLLEATGAEIRSDCSQ